MQFYNDEEFLGTTDMTRDVKDQFVKSKQSSYLKNEGHLSLS